MALTEMVERGVRKTTRHEHQWSSFQTPAFLGRQEVLRPDQFYQIVVRGLHTSGPWTYYARLVDSKLNLIIDGSWFKTPGETTGELVEYGIELSRSRLTITLTDLEAVAGEPPHHQVHIVAPPATKWTHSKVIMVDGGRIVEQPILRSSERKAIIQIDSTEWESWRTRASAELWLCDGQHLTKLDWGHEPGILVTPSRETVTPSREMVTPSREVTPSQLASTARRSHLTMDAESSEDISEVRSPDERSA